MILKKCISLRLLGFLLYGMLMFDPDSVESFKSSLDAYYTWPALFPFKFIVPIEQANQVIEMLDDPNLTSRPSANGRYRAFSLEKMMHSSDEVIAVYQQMTRIPGIISI